MKVSTCLVIINIIGDNLKSNINSKGKKNMKWYFNSSLFAYKFISFRSTLLDFMLSFLQLFVVYPFHFIQKYTRRGGAGWNAFIIPITNVTIDEENIEWRWRMRIANFGYNMSNLKKKDGVYSCIAIKRYILHKWVPVTWSW